MLVLMCLLPGILYTIDQYVLLDTVTIPVWLAGKAITGGKATFGDALLATLLRPIVYFVVVFLVGYFLGSSALIFGYILALIAWIGVFKVSFQTGWLRAILIAILASVIFIVLSIIIGALFGLVYPAPFFPKI